MSRSRIVTLLAILFVVAGIFFALYEKREYTKRLEEIKQESAEVEKIVALKTLWSAKGMQKRLKTLFSRVPKEKIERLKLERNKADIKINSLDEKEINYLLTKLAMLPLSFKKLTVAKSGNQFILETLCVW